MNRDPIGYEGSEWNLYEYASSRPILFVDPSGMVVAAPPPPVGTIITIGGGAVGGEAAAGAGTVCATTIGGAVVCGVGIGIGLYEGVTKPLIEPILEDILFDSWRRPRCDEPARKCKLIGSGGCNKKAGLKRCTYSCDGGPAEDHSIPCGPGNWEPKCPRWDGSDVYFW